MIPRLRSRMPWRSLWLHSALVILTVFCGTWFAAPKAQAAASIPYKINFQGRLTDQNGNILPNGAYNIKFRIWDAASGGTNKWEEDRVYGVSDYRVTVTNGLFNIQFGDVTALTQALFSGVYPLYLEVELPTPATVTCATNGCASFTEGAMTPRQALASAPYAFNADSVDGIDGGSLVVLSSGSAQAGSISVTGTVTAAGTLNAPSAVLTGTNALTIGSTSAAAGILLQDGTANNYRVTLGTAALAASYALILPNSAPATSQCLQSGSSTASQLVFAACTSGSYINNSSSVQTANFNVSGTGVVSGGLTVGTAFTLTTATNSATAFQVQASGPVNVLTVDTNGKNVIIGSNVAANTAQINLQLDSSSVYTEVNACSTTTNQGALYYNTVTNALRGCVNGGWEDLITTAGLGIITYGVVADSASAAAPGDVAGLSANVNSPCKVTWTSANSVTVNPCIAYSGGRKLVIPSTPLSTAAIAASAYTNVCLSGTNSQPTLTAASASETLAGVPAFSANNPMLCLATLRMSTTAGNVLNIWDTRVFTNTDKEFVTLTTASSPGYIVIGTNAAANAAATIATAASGPIRGVVVATSGTASTTTVNAIVAVRGTQYAKFLSGGTATVNGTVQTAGSAGYAQTAATATTATNYAWAGILLKGIDTACNAATNCQYAGLIDLNPSR